MRENCKNTVIRRFDANRALKLKAKSIRKTFKFNNYFFSKVFLFSFYNCLIVTIKVFTRFIELRRQYIKIEPRVTRFF